MGYMHIDNLYKNMDILMFRECYAMEKIHGTSAHIKFYNDNITFFSGGERHELFVSIFNHDELKEKFLELGHQDIIVYGEAYGGKCQGMKETYGNKLKFIVFEVKIGDTWLNVPNAHDVATKLGLEFVHYEKVPTEVHVLNILRDAPSVQAVRNGIMKPMPREGIVLRPLEEVTKNNGQRIICKHKSEKFMETKTPRKVNPDKMIILREANEIAEEWVTPMRLNHVLDKIENKNIENTGNIIKAMVEDIERESSGEVIMSKEAKTAISKKTAMMFKEWLKRGLNG